MMFSSRISVFLSTEESIRLFVLLRSVVNFPFIIPVHSGFFGPESTPIRPAISFVKTGRFFPCLSSFVRPFGSLA